MWSCMVVVFGEKLTTYFSVRHEQFNEYELTPTVGTSQKMRQAGILLKRQANKFVLFAEKKTAGQLQQPEGAAHLYPLLFSIQPTNPYFSNYSQLPLRNPRQEFSTETGQNAVQAQNSGPLRNAKEVVCFTINSGTSETGVIHKEAVVSEADLTYFSTLQVEFPQEFGKVAPWGVLLVDRLPVNPEKPPVYQFKLSARSVFWRYVVYGRDEKRHPNLLSIKRKTSTQPERGEVFDQKGGRDTGVVFQSKTPIALRQVYDDLFQLIDQTGKVLIDGLPRPRVDSLVRVEEGGVAGELCSEMLIYL